MLAWLFARTDGAQFYLRIEDLDAARVAAGHGARQRIVDDLHSLGIGWDEPVLTQSERFEIYRDAAQSLETYECFCTRKEIAQASSAPHGGYRPYPGTCAHLTQGERDQRRLTRRPALRVRAHGAQMSVTDLHRGTIRRIVDDFVLFRADGTPAYNLACVVDDAASGVTQVCRGDDLAESAPRQAWLARELGYQIPTYIHVGLAVNAEGNRLAKRDGAVTMRDLRAKGISPAQILTMLASSAGLIDDDRTVASVEQLWNEIADRPWWEQPAIWEPWTVSGL